MGSLSPQPSHSENFGKLCPAGASLVSPFPCSKKKKGDRELAERKGGRFVKSLPLKLVGEKQKRKNPESKDSNEPRNFGGDGEGSPAGQGECRGPSPASPGCPGRAARPSPEPPLHPRGGAAGEAARQARRRARGCGAGGARPGRDAAGDRAPGGRWGGGGGGCGGGREG